MVLESSRQSIGSETSGIVSVGEQSSSASSVFSSIISSSSTSDLLEAMVDYAGVRIGEEDIIRANDEFFILAGKVFHGDPFYENRMLFFQDYYLFERNTGNGTPFERLILELDQGSVCLPESVSMRIRDLRNHRHSLFEVRKVGQNWLFVEDLANGQKFRISSFADSNLYGFEKKDIFQGFLYPSEDMYQVSNGLISHPGSAKKVIRSRFLKSLKNPAFNLKSSLYILATQNIRYLRHQHVDARSIYSTEPR